MHAIFDEDGGIPVLGDFDSSGNNQLRGYFTKHGNFKKYPVAQDEWIANSKKFFKHGTAIFNDATIIDANVSDSGNKIVVTGGFYHDSHILNANYVRLPVNDITLMSAGLAPWKYFVSFAGYSVERQILVSAAFPNTKIPAQFFINDTKGETLDLEPYAKDVEQRALDCAGSIMAQSYTVEELQQNDMGTEIQPEPGQYGAVIIQYNYCKLEDFREKGEYRIKSTNTNYATSTTVDDDVFSPPDEPFIAFTSAHILTSNISEDSFDGLVFASTYGYCFPYIRPRMTVDFEESGDGKSIIERIYEWKCVPFGFSAIYKIGEDEPVAFRDFGGIDSDVMIIKDDKAFLYNIGFGHPSSRSIYEVKGERHIRLMSGLTPKDLDEHVFFPVGKGFYRMNKFGRLTFFNSEKNIVAENIPIHDDFYHIEIEHGEFYNYFDTDFNNKPQLKCKIYTSDGNVEEKVMNIGGSVLNDGIERIFAEQGYMKNSLAPIDGYYIKYPTGLLEPLHFTPLFYEFNNGYYLCGVKGGKLYKVDRNGNIEQVGDGLKNFRLRELKKISKAKK